ncbi:hypothetical protein [Pyxidicoccus xibeiensis]|uniref:hypothetical protein n=1 Tax=Pyxidicoccus xibeiensis TaxID=2906759 RepID=UPI0020A801E9|nr:hypothetical protein [Pyxidicoccus xibeiensis]MCP3140868.1 hypothetical protein [Pyxidicoccus xibeiensis]
MELHWDLKGSRELRLTVPQEPRSLCWQGDALVDWAGDCRRLGLDGTLTRVGIGLAYSRFDAAVATPDGRCAVVYERRGTKGLLLHDGRYLREIDRSCCHAEVSDYPVALVRRPEGRLLLVHCPEDSGRLEVEDFFTGERLTPRSGEPPDIFHARLLPAPDGRSLLAEGWIWHPVDVVQRIDLDAALADPAVLDAADGLGLWKLDFDTAVSGAFGADGAFLVNSATSHAEQDGSGYRWRMEPKTLVRLDPSTGKVLHEVQPEVVLGHMMPVGHTHVMGFYLHPTLVELATGRVVHRWTELDTGPRLGSTSSFEGPMPALAMDPRNRRFAVGRGREVVVVMLGEL